MKYTPEQITELLEEVQTAREAATPGPWTTSFFAPGYIITDYPLHKAVASVLEYNEDGSVHHEFDNWRHNRKLIANAPSWLQQLTEIVQQQSVELSEAWKAYDNLKAEMEALGKAKDAEIEQMKNELEIADEALGLIEHGVPGQDAADIATEALDRINQADEDDIVRSMNSGPVDLEPDDGSQETEGSKANA
ncbi:hypothetical protein [Paenibacillus oleatilyticus]|uniref:hypothetical protein n=1 Tax=Paenibacillus oleatilyticus TaxID=2594886 RepID=UPI001C1F22E1|nr:hypothetical protein [Paenibacillus oleatilyticus]MBU7319005.1 hypothetical protein [Paenibacillus oleatilyticus]